MRILFFSLLISFSAQAFDQSHQAWDKILKQVVKYEGSQSYVDYAGLKAKPQALDAYLKSLSAVTCEGYETWKADDKLAFLINAYNAFTLKLIIDNYPTKSIKDLGSFLKSPWKKEFFTILKDVKHLDGIEHDEIRKKFDEPRIHFAIVCASIGCPPLHDFAFTGKDLNTQLEKATIAFLSDKAKNSYDPKSNKLKLSKIFKWYGDDFKKQHGSYVKFVSKYMGVTKEDPSVSWNSYDWGLNEKK